ncbi:MAG: nitrous oxide reductase family maturation protein NosD [Kofleriaceae bacterium]
MSSRGPAPTALARRRRPLGLALAGLAAAATATTTATAACNAPRGRAHVEAPRLEAPSRPAKCREVPDGADVQTALDQAVASGGALCLAPGRYQGPLSLRGAVTLWGPRTAVIATSGSGTTVRLLGAGARLLGVTVDGSGGRYDQLDAAVSVAADDTVVEGVTIEHAIYGILSERARRVRIHGNHVRGDDDPSIGLRGDTIRLWETYDSEVSSNFVEDGRDIVVWYSRNNKILDNRVVRGRYGTHFMYSHDSDVERNQYVDGTVGVFVMYSRDVTLRDNVIANAAGAAGIAIGLKDSGTVTIADNLLVHDQVGIYLDSTPQGEGQRVLIQGNQLRLCQAAVVFHSSGHHTRVIDNDFAGNQTQSRVDGGGDALDVAWEGNYFDDYAGYDLDGDGVGDVPYELRSFAGALIERHPNLEFLVGTPALSLADAAAHLDPLFQPRPVLIDRQPRMRAARPQTRLARRGEG